MNIDQERFIQKEPHIVLHELEEKRIRSTKKLLRKLDFHNNFTKLGYNNRLFGKIAFNVYHQSGYISQESASMQRCCLCNHSYLQSDMYEHLMICKANTVACPSCSEDIPISELDDHQRASCPSCMRQCAQCGMMVQILSLAFHMMNCRKTACFDDVSSSGDLGVNARVLFQRKTASIPHSHVALPSSDGNLSWTSTDSSDPVIMYHGTSAAAADNILRNGFIPSTKGLLGPGVYLSRNTEKARAYGPVVIEVVVHLGRVAVIDSKNHPLQKCWYESGFESSYLPEGAGVSKSGLEEHCVYDPSRIAVKGIATTSHNTPLCYSSGKT